MRLQACCLLTPYGLIGAYVAASAAASIAFRVALSADGRLLYR